MDISDDEGGCDPAACGASADPDGCACGPGDQGDEPGDSGSGGGRRGGPSSPAPQASPTAPEDPLARRRRPADLIVPLATLLGLAERPGEIQGFGLLDPALARDLAATATTGPKLEVCVTITSPEGYAIGHGCARPERAYRTSQKAARPLTGFPARLNLTIPPPPCPAFQATTATPAPGPSPSTATLTHPARPAHRAHPAPGS